MEPLQALSWFFMLSPLAVGAVAWAMVVVMKRRGNRAYDGYVEASSEEILEELDREFTPRRRTTIRTQTEYLPFLFECIRENIDSGFEDAQLIALLGRIERHQPDQERSAVFTVISGDRAGDLHLRWFRDPCDRILLRIEGPPAVIRALQEHKRRIPKAVVRSR